MSTPAVTLRVIVLVIFFNFCCHKALMAQGDKKGSTSLEALLESGKAKLQKGQADTAELMLAEVSKQAKQQNKLLIFAQAEISIGRMHADKGENVVALKHYQDALTTAEHIQNKSLVAHVYKNVGALYISWKKFDDALANYDKAEAIAAEIDEQELVADCQNNKGTVYEQKQQYDKAITAYKNALEIYTGKNITAKISMALSNVAIVYKYQKNYPESLKYNQKALTLSEKTGDNWMMAATLNNIGNLYGEMGQYAKAIENCEKALKLSKQINAIEIVECTYDSMADAAAKAGDFKNAFKYHKQFSDANSKFINTENTKQLAELNVKYETERKQKLIQQQQFEISKKNFYLYGSVVLLILVFVVAYLIIRNYKYRQEQYLRTQLYKQQELATKALFEGEQKERIRIARDLHDSIGQMLSVVKMNLSNISVGNQVLTGTLELVDETIGEVRNISHNLIPEELNFGLFAAIDELCSQLNLGGLTRVSLEIPDDARMVKFERGNELSIYRIIQEVLGNMVKHAQATQVDITIQTTPGKMAIMIKDNGKGFDTSKIHQSEGIGWKNIAARIKFLDADLQIHSEKITGTQIDISIPI
jgi:two-component system NarL family sensor kinase